MLRQKDEIDAGETIKQHKLPSDTLFDVYQDKPIRFTLVKSFKAYLS